MKIRNREANALRSSRLFGFLLGAVGAGTGMYTYVVQEYKVSNELLTEDIYVCLPSSIHDQRGRADANIGAYRRTYKRQCSG
jgi:hypothetical protein